jgi:hypothetical protein
MDNTSSLPRVGDNVLSFVGNGQPTKANSRYTKAVPKGTMGRGKSPTGASAIKSNKRINEANGPKCTIVSKLYQANAAESSATERNVRIMSSCCGVSDFQKARSVAGSVY